MKFLFAVLLYMFTQPISNSQERLYRLKKDNGAYCEIRISQKKDQVKASVFAWWNTPSGRHGIFSGSGTRGGDSCLIAGPEQTCRLKLVFHQRGLDAVFQECMDENIPEDFNGRYLPVQKSLQK